VYQWCVSVSACSCFASRWNGCYPKGWRAMPTVDRNAMPPAQRAAWDRLWRVLLTPESEQKTRVTESLAADSDAGEQQTAKS
jgi:hypothetical protein